MLLDFQSLFSFKVGTGVVRTSWAATLTFLAALLAFPLGMGATPPTEAIFNSAQSALSASFSNPQGVAMDSSGNLYVADPGSSAV